MEAVLWRGWLWITTHRVCIQHHTFGQAAKKVHTMLKLASALSLRCVSPNRWLSTVRACWQVSIASYSITKVERSLRGKDKAAARAAAHAHWPLGHGACTHLQGHRVGVAAGHLAVRFV